MTVTVAKPKSKLGKILAAIGLDLAGLLLFDFINKDANEIHRNVVTEILTDTALFEEFDFVAQPDACEVCLDLMANGPYTQDNIPEGPHPHCRCEIWPRRTQKGE